MPALKWTEEAVRQEALKYQTRKAFFSGCGGAYNRAKKLGVFEDVCAHMHAPARRRINDIHTAARKFRTKSEFCKGAPPEFQAAWKLGILDDICSHMPPANVLPPEGEVRHVALRHKTRKDFQAEAGRHYSAAQGYGVLQEVCAHMDRPRVESNVLYIWRAVGEYFNSKPVYKLGITCEGSRRIHDCARNRGLEAETIISSRVRGHAPDHEKILHILGDDPQYATGDGKTEFRALSDSELQEAIQYIEEVAA